MVARYICEICGHELDPKSNTVMRLLTGWVKGTTNSIKVVDINHFRYQHEFCRGREGADQPSLF